MKYLEEFLASLGVPSETIEALKKEPEEGQSIDVKKYVEEQRARYNELIKHDPDFIDPITQSITGKERGTIEGKIKRLLKDHLEEEEINSLEGYDNFIGKIGEVIEGAKNHNADSEKLQGELMEANKEIKRLIDEEIPKIRTEAERTHKEYVIGTKLAEKIAGHELIVNPRAAKSILNDTWSGKYNLDIEEDSLVVKTSDGNDVLNADKTAKLTVDDLMKETFKEANIIKQSNGKPEPTPGGTPTPTKKVTGVPYLDKM